MWAEVPVGQGIKTLLESPEDTQSSARLIWRLKDGGLISSAAEEAVGWAVGRDKEGMKVSRGHDTWKAC